MNFFKEIYVKNLPLTIFQIVLFSLLQSCSGSQFGKRLTNSFDTPVAVVKTSNNTVGENTEKILVDEKNNKSLKKDIPILKTNVAKSNLSRSNRNSPLKESKFIKLKPYRIIIKLYGEDPSAPAQIVTSALRNAGVEFEVEKIEKFDANDKLKGSSVR